VYEKCAICEQRRAAEGRVVEDGLAPGRDWPKGATLPKTRKPSCDDCFFKKNHLCALKLDGPCPTFRPADRNLAPERQLAFVFRTERTTSAYAFPQPTL
jgi:hypothetical protein